jgi:hypothetical protein
LTYRQSIDITIDANEFSSTNKKLDIYMRSDINGISTEVLLIGDINLPFIITQLVNCQILHIYGKILGLI